MTQKGHRARRLKRVATGPGGSHVTAASDVTDTPPLGAPLPAGVGAGGGRAAHNTSTWPTNMTHVTNMTNM
jgi:hypothetical protein